MVMDYEKKTDSIPRASISQILQTLNLVASANNGITFEPIRVFLQQQSSKKAPSTRTVMWTTARDVLSELQRLGLVTVGALPRKRSDVDRLRDTPCRITDRGKELAFLYNERRGQVFDKLLMMWMNEHPYFRSFTVRLLRRPLYLPDITRLKQLEVDKQRPQDTSSLIAAILDSCATRLVKIGFPEEQLSLLEQGIGSRVEQLQAKLVLSDLDAKTWIDTIEDSVVIPSFLETERLLFDPVTFQHLLKTSRDFFSGASTSAHPDFEGRIIFSTCEFRPDPLSEEHAQVTEVIHHGQSFAIEQFSASLISAYHRLAGSGKGYVDAYAIRALVCVNLNIQPQVFAACLGSLIAEGASNQLAIYTELPFTPPPG